MKISVVGCGLLGSMVAYPLASFSVALAMDPIVTLFDHDVVEKRNSPANLCVPLSIGDKKVDVVGQVYSSHGIDVTGVPVRLTGGNSWMLQDSELVVGAVDNVETRRLLLSATRKFEIPYLDMGLNDLAGVVSWSSGKFSNMQFADGDIEYKPPVDTEKQPACDLVATRLISAIVTECAVRSIFIYQSGHDPAHVVFELTGQKARNRDMVSWHVSVGGGSVVATPTFFGNLTGGENVKE